MSTRNQIGNEVSVEEQTNEQTADGLAAEAAVESVELRASVAQEIQAKVDTLNPEAVGRGLTLAQEERIQAREAELARYAERAREHEARGLEEEAMNRTVAVEMGRQETERFEEGVRERAIGIRVPPKDDPREKLGREELGQVNAYAVRVAESVTNGPTRAVVSRRIAEYVEEGVDVTTAVLKVKDELISEPGVIEPIGLVEPWQYEADVEGEVVTLWKPASSTQQQVGLLRDETGTVKLTIWKKSQQSVVFREGDRVQVRAAKVGFYNGRVTLAADSWTVLERIEEGDGPAPIHSL